MEYTTRRELLEKLFPQVAGKRFLVLGMGGGGDVISTLPTCFDLQRLGAHAIPAGVSWKRRVHDPVGRPRTIAEFANLRVVNNLIGFASADTTIINGPRHIESWLAERLSGSEIGVIDVSAGSGALCVALQDLLTREQFDQIIAIDAGGDVLCFGDEPTIESPLCDQIVLAAIAPISGSLLGIHSFGTDGELSMSGLRKRFTQLLAHQAYHGAIDIAPEDHSRLTALLEDAPTESSRYSVGESANLSPNTRATLRNALNGAAPTIDPELFPSTPLALRDGTRQGEIGPLAAFTLFFTPTKVFASSRFSSLWNDHATSHQLHQILSSQGLTTEYNPPHSHR